MNTRIIRQRPSPTQELDDAVLARKWWLRRVKLAQQRGEQHIVLSVRLAQALRPLIVSPNLRAGRDGRAA